MTCSIKFLYSLKITYKSSLTFINAFVNRYSLFNKSILGVISTTCNHAKVNRVNIAVIDEMAWTSQKAEGKKKYIQIAEPRSVDPACRVHSDTG